MSKHKYGNISQVRLKSTMSVYDSEIADKNNHISNTQTSSPPTKCSPIYVSATRQHVGKTTTCLALMSGLKKRFPNSIGFLKPVGQQHVPVYSDVIGETIRVDKDVTLIKEHFQLNHCDYRHMSPVLIPSGYTKYVRSI